MSGSATSTLRRARRCPPDVRILLEQRWSASSSRFRRLARLTNRSRSSVRAGEADRVRKQLQANIERLHSKQDVINVQYFERLTALGPGEDSVDRQLDQLGAKSAVDDEFARLKAEASRALRTPRCLPTTPARLTTQRHSGPLMPTARLLPLVSSPDPLVAGFAHCNQRVWGQRPGSSLLASSSIEALSIGLPRSAPKG